jgi:predicted secreted Zn-dependent protease
VSVEFSGPEQIYYEVSGDSLTAVAQLISLGDEAGKSEWLPRYDYAAIGDNLSSITVTVSTKITMPQWSGYASASQPEKDEWDRFVVALQNHDQGYIELVIQQLSNIDEQMIGRSVSDAGRAWDNALEAVALASDAYDRRTDHGRNQGTIINPCDDDAVSNTS